MKILALVAGLLLSSMTAQAYTTLSCVAAYKNPVVNTHFHVPVTLKINNKQIKKIDKLNKTTAVLNYDSNDRSGSRMIFVSDTQDGFYLAVDNRNWTPSAIQLGEQMYVYEGRIRDGRAEREVSTLDCKTVPTLSRF